MTIKTVADYLALVVADPEKTMKEMIADNQGVITRLTAVLGRDTAEEEVRMRIDEILGHNKPQGFGLVAKPRHHGK